MRHVLKYIAVFLLSLYLRIVRGQGRREVRNDLNDCRILISAMIGLGNSVLALPMVAALKKSFPLARIDILTKDQSCRAIFAASGLADQIHVLAGSGKEKWHTLRRLRAQGYDLGVLTFPTLALPQEVLPFFLKIKGVAAHDYSILHPYFGRLKKHFAYCQPVRAKIHDIEQNKLLLSPWVAPAEGIDFYPDINLPEDADAKANAFLAERGIQAAEKIVGFHPGSRQGAVRKRWPFEYYLALADRLCGEAGTRAFFFLGPDEIELQQQMADRRFLVVQSDNLFEVMALLRKCSLFISNDSGIMHTASLCGIPLLTIWGGTDEHRNAARGHSITNVLPEGFICRPCIDWVPRYPCPYLPKPCVHSIDVSRVFKIALPLVAVQSAPIQ
ncbi:MAG TPA: glycosyltransferase family 9 protein [bacterium]|nr:glycosyltransferase family 9 protein [bacterium]